MSSQPRTVLARLLVPVVTLYLAFLAVQPPPARWVGLACLAVVVPLLVGRVLGQVGVAPPMPAGVALDFAEDHLAENTQRFTRKFEEWHEIRNQ